MSNKPPYKPPYCLDPNHYPKKIYVPSGLTIEHTCPTCKNKMYLSGRSGY